MKKNQSNIVLQTIGSKRAKVAKRRRKLFAQVQSVKSVKANNQLLFESIESFDKSLFLEDLKSPLNRQTLLQKAKSAITFKVRHKHGILKTRPERVSYHASLKKAIQAI